MLKLKLYIAILNIILMFAMSKVNKLLTFKNKYYGNNDIKTIL